MDDIIAVMKQRHSVRQYTDREIPEEIRKKLSEETEKLNQESGLHMQLLFDEPECFDSPISRYGKFTGVKNYLAIVGKKDESLYEKSGYYGEKIVLLAQSLGLNSCWVAMTHGRSKAFIKPDEKLSVIVALGYGSMQGTPHFSKPMDALCSTAGAMPEWFEKGMEGAMLAPTAMNQQKFMITWDTQHLRARVNGNGFYTKMDLGIVKNDFELASGHRFDA